MIIELDGEVHNTLEVEALDTYKQSLLSQQWYNIIRFDNSEIINTLQNCIKNIRIHCSPSP
jgi:very-short-patch-repair endonuclease